MGTKTNDIHSQVEINRSEVLVECLCVSNGFYIQLIY